LKFPTLALGFALIASMPAHAYLDGGTGSIIAQLLIGGTASLVIVLKLYWYKIKSFFSFGKTAEDAKAPDVKDTTELDN